MTTSGRSEQTWPEQPPTKHASLVAGVMRVQNWFAVRALARPPGPRTV